MKKQERKSKKGTGTLRRLVWANVIAWLAALTTAVVVLWALGLLQSIVAFLL